MEPVVSDVEPQPLAAQVARVVQALKLAGAPLDEERARALDAAAADPSKAAAAVQEALDPLCLAVISVNPESRVKVAEGPAEKMLFQHGWRVFLVKVVNEAGITAKHSGDRSKKAKRRALLVVMLRSLPGRRRNGRRR